VDVTSHPEGGVLQIQKSIIALYGHLI
jgi:hypothetical protein